MGKPWSASSYQAQRFTWAEILGQIESEEIPYAYKVWRVWTEILSDADEDRTVLCFVSSFSSCNDLAL